MADDDLVVIANVADGSRLDFICTGDSDRFAASAVYHPEPSPDIEIWKPSEIVEPAFKRKTLSASDLSYAITTTVAFFGSDKTEARVIALIKAPGAETREHVVLKVSGANGATEYSHLLIVMA